MFSAVSDEVSGKFWRWLSDRLGDTCASCPSDSVGVQREIVQGKSMVIVCIYIIINN